MSKKAIEIIKKYLSKKEIKQFIEIANEYNPDWSDDEELDGLSIALMLWEVLPLSRFDILEKFIDRATEEELLVVININELK